MLGEHNGHCEDKHIEELRGYILNEQAFILEDINRLLRTADNISGPLLAAFSSLLTGVSTIGNATSVTTARSHLVGGAQVHAPPSVITRLLEIGDLGTALRIQGNLVVYSLQWRDAPGSIKSQVQLYRDIHQQCIRRLSDIFPSSQYLDSAPPIHNLLLLPGITDYLPLALAGCQEFSRTDMFGRDLGFLAFDLEIDDVIDFPHSNNLHGDVWGRRGSHLVSSWRENIEWSEHAAFSDSDVLPKDNKGRTALHIASGMGNASLVRFLIQDTTDIHAEDNLGRTPLLYAVASGHAATTAVILQDTSLENLPNLCWLATESGSASVVDVITRTDGFPYKEVNLSHLQLAIDRGKEDALHGLLRLHTGIEARDGDGRTLLSYATNKNQEKVVEVLIYRYDAEVNTTDVQGLTPLMIAVRNGYSGMVSVLLNSAKANMDCQDNQGSTALHWAIRNGHSGMVGIFCKNGADFDIKDDNGWTPLFVAVEQGDMDAVESLLCWVSSIRVRDNKGRTVFDINEMHPNKGVFHLLKDYEL